MAIDFKSAVIKSKNNLASALGFSVYVNHFSLIVFSIIPPHFRIWTLVTGCFTEYRIWNVRNNNFILLFFKVSKWPVTSQGFHNTVKERRVLRS